MEKYRENAAEAMVMLKTFKKGKRFFHQSPPA